MSDDVDAEEDDDEWETPVPPPQSIDPLPEVKNPILLKVRDSMRGRTRHITMPAPEPGTTMPVEFIEKFFGTDICRDLGKELLEALVNDDQNYAATVAEALKGAGVLFNRSKRKDLSKLFFQYIEGLPVPRPTKTEIFRGFKDSINHIYPGADLSSAQVKDLCEQYGPLDAAQGKAGRPRKNRGT